MDLDCIIVGAGVVGLAIARELARSGRDCVIVERGSVIGNETSSRNSEVIHAGIYYPQGSQKAEHCVAGKLLLYDYLESHHIPYRRLTKLIVASSVDEVPTLEQINARAIANGVDDLQPLDEQQALQLEPALNCKAALLSPSTGIVDSHAFMLSLLGEAEDCGAMLALSTDFESAQALPGGGFKVSTDSDGESTELTAREIINSAGLGAQQVAASVEGLAPEFIPPRLIVKGNYFNLSGPSPFSRLIYPVPEKHGLGVHITLDLAGSARFGPDTESIEQDSLDYDVDPRRCDVFYDAVRRYWPGLKDDALVPAYSGIRPKVQGDVQDFRIEGAEVHGVEGLVNCFAIESPGLTASLSLARAVLDRLRG